MAGAVLLRGNGLPWAAASASLEPLSCSWNVTGGPKQAKLRARGRQMDLAGWQDRLGNGLEIYNGQGELIWWGYLNRVSQRRGAMRFSASLSEMANRVAVRYEVMEPGEVFPTHLQTNWADDLLSQARYGIKERVIEKGKLGKTPANTVRDLALKELAFPSLRCSPDPRGGGVGVTDSAIELEALGWMETLAWRIFTAAGGQFGHASPQQGTQVVGAASASQKLAQPFIAPQTMDLTFVHLRVRKVGAPADNLLVRIESDAAGQPSGSVLVSRSLAGSGLNAETYPWTLAPLYPALRVTAGTRYWLVLGRSGAVSAANHYSLGLDEALGFTEGTCRLFDQSLGKWNRRVPEANLLFRAGGTKPTGEQLLDIAQGAGQKFTAVSLNCDTGFSSSPIQRVNQNALQVFADILRMGTSRQTKLFAHVDARRQLMITEQQAEQGAGFHLDLQGRLRDSAHRLAHPDACSPGSWVSLPDGRRVIVQAAGRDFANGRDWLALF